MFIVFRMENDATISQLAGIADSASHYDRLLLEFGRARRRMARVRALVYIRTFNNCLSCAPFASF